ncbi:MAG: helix-turn-helix transcriptional regulator [Rhodospirillaceae bacterium]|nr:helix-turn-helix transcriptional regulator [Rhodospirillaceae bacterium]MYH37729.1 helix-turn-helix transcriptional regulator [Rhodospirillaceae bacterium]MYK16417.1 helix-turn-helix transcriptional regulator [Rhodospirillaceae bacterium]MYK58940.1 helix-turn-helix transcriptional regulator [Rhodospirillaceae bacterium]
MTQFRLVKGAVEEQLIALGRRIRLLRKQAKLNQSEFALMMGVSDATVSTWERGTGTITMEMVYRLAVKFECSVSYLVLGHDGTRPPVSHDELVDRVSALEAAVFVAKQSVAPKDRDAAADTEIGADMVKAAIEEINFGRQRRA